MFFLFSLERPHQATWWVSKCMFLLLFWAPKPTKGVFCADEQLLSQPQINLLDSFTLSQSAAWTRGYGNVKKKLKNSPKTDMDEVKRSRSFTRPQKLGYPVERHICQWVDRTEPPPQPPTPPQSMCTERMRRWSLSTQHPGDPWALCQEQWAPTSGTVYCTDSRL